MLVAFVKPALVSVAILTSGNPFPRYDIETICQSTSVLDHSHLSLHACRHDERAARDQLRSAWPRIPAPFRQACTGDAIAVSPTYTDLSSCIDGYTEVGKENGRTAAAPKAVTIPDTGVR